MDLRCAPLIPAIAALPLAPLRSAAATFTSVPGLPVALRSSPAPPAAPVILTGLAALRTSGTGSILRRTRRSSRCLTRRVIAPIARAVPATPTEPLPVSVIAAMMPLGPPHFDKLRFDSQRFRNFGADFRGIGFCRLLRRCLCRGRTFHYSRAEALLRRHLGEGRAFTCRLAHFHMCG